jgi:hypothetical protein
MVHETVPSLCKISAAAVRAKQPRCQRCHAEGAWLLLGGRRGSMPPNRLSAINVL